jgi:DUF1680 family protein
MPTPSHRLLEPALEASGNLHFSIDGWLGDRIRANELNWLIPAPDTNPGMVEMFAHRQNLRFGNTNGDTRDPVPWAGEFAGKYLLSAVQSLRLTANPDLESVVRRFVPRLIATQGTDGSLGLPIPWDLWGQYHVMGGLLRWYEITGDASALAACQRAADLACARYLGRVSAIASDHPDDAEKNQAIAHALSLLYEHTGQAKYLDLVHGIETEWTRPPLGGNFLENAIAGKDFFASSRPRWESLHDVQAIAELYFITGQARYRQAFEQIWRSIRALDRHATGGFTSGEAATGNAFDPRYIETCGTVAWMALSIDMLRMTADSTAADELDLSLFNAILGGQSPDGRLWTYHTPMGGIPIDGIVPAARLGYRLPALYDLGWQARDRYPQLSCCAANGPRGIGCLAEWAVMQSREAIVINYYGPLTARLVVPSGTPVTLIQSTSYPADGVVNIKVDPARAGTFAIRLRIPAWSRDTTVEVNGVRKACTPGTYCELNREWHSGDVIHLKLDMSVRIAAGARNAAGLTVAYRGPLLLALDSADGQYDLSRPPTLKMTPAPRIAANSGGLPRVVFQSSQGAVSLRDFASAGQSSEGRLTGRPNLGGVWQFSRSNQTVIAEQVQLLSNGTIFGYSHPNEARWAFDGDVLTFFAQSGAASTRFAFRTRQHGKEVLSGMSLLDSSVRHLLSQVDFGIANKTWQFRRRDRSGETVLLPVVRLLPGGGFDVPTHPNEHRWAMEGETLVFHAVNGASSTRFTSIRMQNGRVEWRGAFLFDLSLTHELVEIELNVTNTMWRFIRRKSGAADVILADKVRLLPNRKIDGYWHPNEAKWEYGSKIGTLVFRSESGAPSTHFDTLRIDQGVMHFEGTFDFDRSITHVLEESAPGWKFDSSYISWLPFER